MRPACGKRVYSHLVTLITNNQKELCTWYSIHYYNLVTAPDAVRPLPHYAVTAVALYYVTGLAVSIALLTAVKQS